MSTWHPYPRYFVIPDRSWRGVAFIDDPLNQDGVYVGQSDGDAPDWRDPDETELNIYSDGVHRSPQYVHDPDLFEDEPLPTIKARLEHEHHDRVKKGGVA